MGDISNEPSMEEILSSIKKIIAEDSEQALSPRARSSVRNGPRPSSPVEDIDPDVNDIDEPVLNPADEEVLELTELTGDDSSKIASAATETATRSALGALSKLVVKPETAGADTLEGLVREMLRPMLKEWLDANLAGIVKTSVDREVARIARLGD